MTEEKSFLFDFTRTDYFFDQLNVMYNLRDMNGSSNKFKLVVCDYGGDNIEDYLDGYKYKSSISIATSLNCPLKWENECIKLANDVNWNVGVNVTPIKAILLCSANNTVLGYCINMSKFTVVNYVKFDKDTIFWSIRDDR